jgi:hypothetical protein
MSFKAWIVATENDDAVAYPRSKQRSSQNPRATLVRGPREKEGARSAYNIQLLYSICVADIANSSLAVLPLVLLSWLVVCLHTISTKSTKKR